MEFSSLAMWVKPIGWTLLHAIWQAAALAIVYSLIVKGTNWSSRIKHNIGMGFLVTLAVSSLVTLFWLAPEAAVLQEGLLTVTVTPSEIGSEIIMVETSLLTQVEAFISPYLSWISMVWIIGLVLMSIRLLGGWWYWRYQVTGQAKKLPEEWSALVERMARQVGLVMVPAVKYSERVLVPVVVGVVRPVILLPLAMVN